MATIMSKAERHERLLEICKRIVDDPRSAAGTRGALIQATRAYVKSQYGDLSEEEALENLYNDETELGSLLRRAVAIVGKYDGRRRRGDREGAQPAQRRRQGSRQCSRRACVGSPGSPAPQT
jgi:hypothetical protein